MRDLVLVMICNSQQIGWFKLVKLADATSWAQLTAGKIHYLVMHNRRRLSLCFFILWLRGFSFFCFFFVTAILRVAIHLTFLSTLRRLHHTYTARDQKFIET